LFEEDEGFVFYSDSSFFQRLAFLALIESLGLPPLAVFAGFMDYSRYRETAIAFA